jgi:HD-like signal output (HDOD) protein
MATKSILLAVSDAETTSQIAKALGADWEAISAVTEDEAKGQLETLPFDALLVDFNFGESDGSDLLNLAAEKCPDTVRFLLAYEADLALVAAKVEGTPNILPKPVEAASVKSRIEEGVEESKPKPAATAPVAPTAAAPAIPPVYALVLKALEAPDASSKSVGKVIAKDEALTSEILSLTHSSYLGVQSNFTDPTQAVEALGLDTVKAVVMALQFLAESSQVRPAYLSLDQIWQHGINVGQIARDLVLFETKDRALASQALVAGLLHDLGKVVLAKNFDDLYGRVHSLARKQPVAVWDIEKEMFGANHGEIGGCLVGMWNMPLAIVDAVALHHEPPVGEHEGFTLLAAVHVANVLERELWLGDEEMKVGPIINTPFLNHIGLLQRLPIWRAAFRNRKSVGLDPELTAAAEGDTTVIPSSESRTVNQLPAEVEGTHTVTSGTQPAQSERLTFPNRLPGKRWFYAGAVIAVVLFGVWFGTQPELKQAEPVYARTEIPQQTTAVSTAPAPAPTVTPEAAPTPLASAEPIAHPAPTEVASTPAAVEPALEPEPAVTVSAPAPNSGLSSVTKSEPEFRVNGISYHTTHPLAIVNGKTVGLREKINGAIVVGIGRSTVLLEINGETKTLELK